MGCRVIIEGHEFRANFVLLDIQDFDVILGMDWLSRHHATMDCFMKRSIDRGNQRLLFVG